jgi:tetratricopeptide (TPR) repeat protein
VESIKELEESLFLKLKDNPVDYNTLNKLGYVYLHSNNLLKSEEYYTRSVFIEPSQFEPYVSLGLICTITMRLGRALYFLLKAKEKNPDSLDLLKSIEEINTAIVNKDSKLSDEELDDLMAEAYSYLEQNNVEEAIEIYLRLMNISLDNENILLNLGIAFLKKKDYILAYELFLDLISKFPGNAMPYHYAAITANYLNEIDQAKEFFLKSLEIKPSMADYVSNGKYAHYKKDYGQEVITNCPVCSKEDFQPVVAVNQSIHSYNFNIINPFRLWVQCQNCSLTFANPRPSEGSLQKYAFELSYYSNNVLDADIRKVTLESNAYNERLNRIEQLTGKRKGLDIISDYGIYLSLAKTRGWDVTGFEESLLKARKIKEVQGLEIINSSFKNYNITETYDLVTLWESLEKIPDFLGIFRKVHKILNKDGIFAFSFHGKDTFMAKTLGPNYPLWSYPDYLYFFESENLKPLLKDIGFKIVDMQVVCRKYLSNVEIYCQK